MIRPLLISAILLSVFLPCGARGALWNLTPGHMTYEGSVRGVFETTVYEGLVFPAATYWEYEHQVPSGLWSEGIAVYANDTGDICFLSVGCNITGAYDESFGGSVLNVFGEPVLVPAEPYVGQSWQWVELLYGWTEYNFTVSAQEFVDTGEGPLLAWRIDLELVGSYDTFSICNETLLPFTTESYWVAEGYGVVKWVIPTEEFTLVSVDYVVPVDPGSVSALKARFKR